MKGKVKNIISCLMAVVIIASMFAFVLPISAQEKSAAYAISAASPAIPMYVNHKIDLNSVAVEFAEGSVSGKNITWDASAYEASDLAYDAATNTLTAYSEGKYKLTVSATGYTAKNVWVIVNKKDDNNFYLVDLDLTKAETFTENTWLIAKNTTTDGVGGLTVADKSTLVTGSPKTPGKAADGVANVDYPKFTTPTDVGPFTLLDGTATGALAVMLFKADILEDFSNYTVVSNYAFYHNANFATNRGVILKADINFSAAVGASIYAENASGGLYLSQRSLNLAAVGPLKGKNYEGAIDTIVKNGLYTYTAGGLTAGSAENAIQNTDHGNGSLAYESKYSEVKVAITGSNIEYSLNGREILDTTADTVYKLTMSDWQNSGTSAALANKTALTDTIDTTSGNAIGFIARTGGLAAKSLKVKLNSDITVPAAPIMTELSYYNISAASPAIPMYGNHKIDLNSVAVEFAEGSVSGKNIAWDASAYEASDLAYDAATNTLTAYKEGRYKLNVSASGYTAKNVWVIVNKKDDNNFYLVDLDLTKAETFTENTWLIATNKTSADGVADLKVADKTLVTESPKTPAKDEDGITNVNYPKFATPTEVGPFTLVDGKNTGEWWLYTMFFKADILEDFSDYTVISKHAFYNNNNYATNRGVILKADINFSATVGASIYAENASGGLYLSQRSRNLAAVGPLKGTNYEGAANTIVKNGLYTYTAGGLTAGSAENAIQNTDHANGSLANGSKYSEVKVAITGRNIEYSLNGKEILDTTADTIYKLTMPDNNSGSGTSAPLSDKTALTNTIDTTSGNAIGLISRAGGLAAKSLKVKLNDTTALPEMTDISAWLVPANTRIALTALEVETAEGTVTADKVEWTPASINAGYEISGGYLIVYKNPDSGNITLNGTYGGNSASLTVKTAAAGTATDYEVTKFAEDYITVEYKGDKVYNITVDEDKAYIPGSLKVTDASTKTLPTILEEAETKTGKKFSCTVLAPHTLNINAEFEDDEQALLLKPNMLGTSIKSESGFGIRFVSGISALRKESDNIAFAVGTDIIEVGTLLVPSTLIDNDESKLKLTEFDTSKSQVKVNEKNGKDVNAANVVISNLSEATESYSLANTVLNNIPESYKALEISCVTYYKKSDGTFIYSDVLTDSYNAVAEKLYPNIASGNTSDWIYGGTDRDLDNNPLTDSVSYAKGEDITFYVKGNAYYTLGYVLEYDGQTEQPEEVKLNSNELKLTTSLNTAGTVKLTVSLYGEDKETPVKTFVMSAIVDAANIVQPLALNDAEYGATAMSAAQAAFTSWKSDWDSTFNQVITAKGIGEQAELAATAWANSFEGKTAGDTFVGYIGETPVIKLKVNSINASTKVIRYDFWIATDIETGIEVYDSKGLFKVGNNVVDYNKRPSTGSVCVDTDKPSGAITASFMGYGSSLPYVDTWVSGTYLFLNSHGMNPEATQETINNTIANVNVADGGISDVIKYFTADNSEAEANTLYSYGILCRDYTALQLAKTFTVWDGSGLQTKGASMGGWQAVLMAALDSTVNNIDVNIPWLCNIGDADNNYIKSDFNPTYCKQLEIFSTVTAAKIINARADSTQTLFTFAISDAGLGDETSPPSGVMALYNAFASDYVNSSVVFRQFRPHSITSEQNNNDTLLHKSGLNKPADIAE